MVVAYYVEDDGQPMKSRSFTTVTVYENEEPIQVYYKKLFPTWVNPMLDDDAGLICFGIECGIFKWDWDSRCNHCESSWLLGTMDGLSKNGKLLTVDCRIAKVFLDCSDGDVVVSSLEINTNARFDAGTSFVSTALPAFRDEDQIRWFNEYLLKLRDAAIAALKSHAGHRVSQYVLDYAEESIKTLRDSLFQPSVSIALPVIESKLLDYFS